MRRIKKRLVVKNDGFAKSKKSAQERMEPVIARYLAKRPGWYVIGESAGNAFFVWEHYLHLAAGPGAYELHLRHAAIFTQRKQKLVAI